jgi:hypothetical protein
LGTFIKSSGGLCRCPSSKDEASTTIHAAVPPVLDGIVTSTMESTSNLSPPLSHFSNHALNLKTFFGADWFVIQRWFEILMVPFPTLLWGARADELSYPDPIQRSLGVYQLAQVGILCLGPRSSSMGCHDRDAEGFKVC